MAVVALCGTGFHHLGTHHPGSISHAHGPHPPPSVIHPTTGHSPAHHGGGHDSHSSSSFWWLAWISPIYLCGAIVGFGLAGALLAPFLQGWLQFGAALGGAYLLQQFCLRPLMAGIAQWTSRPAKTLNDTVLESGTAATNFDAQGFGMVRLNLDGQVIQLLGRLAPEEQDGSRIMSGDSLFIRSVDSARQRCIVCRTTIPSRAQ